MLMKNTGNSGSQIDGDANRSSADSTIMGIVGKWNGTSVADMLIVSGSDTTNKDDGEIVFRTAPSGTLGERMRIASDGKVGIGESSPLATLHVKEGDSGLSSLNSSGTNLFLEASGSNGAGMTIASGNTSNGFIIFGDGDSNFQGAVQYDHSASKMHLTTVGSQRMTIDSSGNVGIGTTSPSDLLHLSASVPIIRLTDSDTSDYHRIYGSNGSLYFDADKGDSVGSSKIAFGVDDSNVMNITDGKVGIGTASPAVTTHIHSDAETFAYVTTDSTSHDTGIWFGHDIDGTAAYTGIVYDRDVYTLKLFNANSIANHLCINNDGEVGIGTASPNIGGWNTNYNVLTIKGDTTNYGGVLELANPDSTGNYFGSVSFVNLDGGSGVVAQARFSATRDGADDASAFVFETEPTGGTVTERMRITSAGFVGIGRTNPNSFLHVEADDGEADDNYVCLFQNKETTDDRSKGVMIQAGSTNTDWALLAEDHDGSNTLMKLTGAGRLGLNISGTVNARLDINEGTSGQELIHLNHSASGVQTMLLFKTSSTTRGSIQSDNSPSQTAYNTSSDERLKENISEVNDALSIVNKIPVKHFNFIEDENNTPVIGYIGQELIKEYPLAVSVIKTDEYDDHHMVDQSKMVAVLMKAVQELSAKVEALENA
jgi:hypothetical protein